MIQNERQIERKHALILLVLLMILGGLFRSYGLDVQSLWVDELIGWNRTNVQTLSEVIEHTKADVHPPAYYIVLYFFTHYIGDSETILRLPSVLFGVLSILGIYLVGSKLYTRREGIISAALMTTLWCPIYYSQEARMYSMLLALVLFSSTLWLSIVDNFKRNEKVPTITIAGYIILATITSYTHYFGLFFIFLQSVYLLLVFGNWKRQFITILSIGSIILIAFSPWIPTMIKALKIKEIWITSPGSGFFVSYLGFLFNNLWILVVIAVGLWIYYFKNSLDGLLSRRNEGFKGIDYVSPGFILVVWLVVPFAVMYVKSILSTPVLLNRSLIISLPAAYILLSRSITLIPVRPRYNSMLVLVSLGLLVLHLVFVMDYYTAHKKEEIREAVGYVIDQDRGYKNTAILGYCYNKAYLDYYFEKKNSDRRVDFLANGTEDIKGATKYLNENKPQYIWFIAAHINPDENFVSAIKKNYKVISNKHFIGAQVLLLEAKEH